MPAGGQPYLDFDKLDPKQRKAYDSLLNNFKKGSIAEKVFKGTRSYDLEAFTNVKKQGSFRDVFSDSWFYPKLGIKTSLKRTKFYAPADKERAKGIIEKSKSFFVDMFKAHEAIGGKGITGSGEKQFKGSFADIQRRLKSGHVGIYNLNFEASTLTQNSKAGLKGMIYTPGRGDEGLQKGLYSRNGRILGNDREIANKILKSDSLNAGARTTGSGISVVEARDSTIDLGETIARKISDPNSGAKKILYDQQHITRAFLAKAQKDGLLKGSDYQLGTGVDVLLQAATGVKEGHIAALDSAAAQGITSSMAGYLLGGERDATVDSILKSYDGIQSEYRVTTAKETVDELFNKNSKEVPIFQQTGTPVNFSQDIYDGDELIGSQEFSVGRKDGKIRGISLDNLRDWSTLDEGEFTGNVRERLSEYYNSQSTSLPDEEVDNLINITTESIRNNTEGRFGLAGKAATETAEGIAQETAETAAKGGMVDWMAGMMDGTINRNPKAAILGMVGVGSALIFGRQMLMHDSLEEPILPGMRASDGSSSHNHIQGMMSDTHPDFPGSRASFNWFSMDLAKEIMQGQAKKPALENPFAWAAVGTGALIAGNEFNNAHDFIFPTTANWGRASKYGVAEEHMWAGMAEEFKESMSPNSEAIVTHGTYIHEELQGMIENYAPNAVSEYAIMDKESKLTGHIDMVVAMKNQRTGKISPTPVEIKTTSLKTLSSMSAPKEGHLAQAQFYLHHLAKENPDNKPQHEVFIYVAREDPGKYKMFSVARDERKFQQYLKRYRSYQRSMDTHGLTPQKMRSNVGVSKEIMRQTPQRRAIATDNDGITYDQLDEIVRNSTASYMPAAFGGINRSSRTDFDFESPLKAKPLKNRPSLALSKGDARKIKSTRNIKPQVTSQHVGMKMTKPKKSSLGQRERSAIMSGNRPRSRQVNSSRAGVT